MSDKSDSSLARLLAVLELFDEQRLALTVDTIVEALQVSQPTAYRYLKLLTDAGLLQRQDDANYSLGPRVIVLDHLIRRSDPMLAQALPYMKELVAGTTLFLPVQVPDALFYVGDPHFAQGDGEVALTALEAPLRATVTLDLVPAEQVTDIGSGTGPFAAGHGLVIPTGLDPDLDTALSLCVGNAVDLLGALFDTDPRSAYLYLSAAADFTVSQAVDLTRGVHGKIRVADFAHTTGTELARYILERAR